MDNLSQKMRMGLKFAACLGPRFEARVLEKARKDNEFDDTFLGSCVEFGFLQEPNPGKYVWAHDQIHQVSNCTGEIEFHFLLFVKLSSIM